MLEWSTARYRATNTPHHLGNTTLPPHHLGNSKLPPPHRTSTSCSPPPPSRALKEVLYPANSGYYSQTGGNLANLRQNTTIEKVVGPVSHSCPLSPILTTKGRPSKPSVPPYLGQALILSPRCGLPQEVLQTREPPPDNHGEDRRAAALPDNLAHRGENTAEEAAPERRGGGGGEVAAAGHIQEAMAGGDSTIMAIDLVI